MILLYIVFSAVFIYLLIGGITCRVFLCRVKKHGKHQKTHSSVTSPASFRVDRDWLDQTEKEDVLIVSKDGTQLHAILIPDPASDTIAICCHGYHANAVSMAGFAKLFRELGPAVLLPDARGHGKSSGNYCGMGWRDRLDLISWINWTCEQYPNKKIILFGVSMGGAEVMNALGEYLPDHVICAIEDSGFASIKDVLQYQIRCRKLPSFILYAADPFCRLLAGFSVFDKTATIRMLSGACVPLLLIHGREDSFVPPEHFYAAAKAYGNKAQTYLADNACHADAIIADRELYKKIISTFIRQFIK